MTAITLNLLAEEQLAEQAEARDPFKVALAIGLSVFALTVLVGTLIAFHADKKRAEAGALQSKWDALTKAEGSIAGTDFNSVRSQVDDIVAINKGRQLFAPQMAFIKDLVPDTIQLGRIDLTVNVEVQEAPAAEATGEAGKTKTARAAKPRNSEHLSLRLSGQAISARPEIEVDQFIRSLRAHPVFSRQLKDVKLRSIARMAVSPTEAGAAASAPTPTADFVIECQYKELK